MLISFCLLSLPNLVQTYGKVCCDIMLGAFGVETPKKQKNTNKNLPWNSHIYWESVVPTNCRHHTIWDMLGSSSSSSSSSRQSLDRFYNFARWFDQYQTGSKEKTILFYSRELAGEFHFIRFESREMEAAMDLIRLNNLHLNICEMGPGAHTFLTVWKCGVLGIKMQWPECSLSYPLWWVNVIHSECVYGMTKLRYSSLKSQIKVYIQCNLFGVYCCCLILNYWNLYLSILYI